MKCPCCKSEVEDGQILVDLNTNSVAIDGQTIKLMPADAELLYILAERMPMPVSNTSIFIKMWGMSEPSSGYNLVKVRIHFLRKALKDTSLKIITHQARGYELQRAA